MGNDMRVKASLFKEATLSLAVFCIAATPVRQSFSFKLQQRLLVERTLQVQKAWRATHHAQSPNTSDSAPAILAGKITVSKVNVKVPPSAPAISVKYATGSSGLNFIGFIFYSPSGQEVVFTYSATTAPTSGTVLVQEPGIIGQYAAAGDYTLSFVDIVDNAGNATYYDSTQLPALFPSLTVTVVNSGQPDDEGPVITSGNITTPTVSLSNAPLFLANALVGDAVSGVHYVYLEAMDESGNECSPHGVASSPIKTPKRLAIGENFATDSVKPGTYTINDILITDWAGNTTYVQDPGQIKSLFGSSTFQVTP